MTPVTWYVKLEETSVQTSKCHLLPLLLFIYKLRSFSLKVTFLTDMKILYFLCPPGVKRSTAIFLWLLLRQGKKLHSQLMDLAWKHVLSLLRIKVLYYISYCILFSHCLYIWFYIYKLQPVNQFQNWKIYRFVYRVNLNYQAVWFWPFTGRSTITALKKVNNNINIKASKYPPSPIWMPSFL